MILENASEPLICRYRWTAEESWKATQYHWKKNLRWLFRALLYLIFGLILIVSVWSLVRQGFFWIPAWFVVFGIYMLFFRRLEARWWYRRRFRRRPDCDALLELRISHDGIASNVEGLGEGRLTWALIFKALRAPDGVVVYTNEQNFLWIPFHGFSSSDAVPELDRLLRAKVPRYESL